MFTRSRNHTRRLTHTSALLGGLIVAIGLAAPGMASASDGESPPITLPPGFVLPPPSDPVTSLPPITIPPTTDPVISLPPITIPPTTDPVITLATDVTIVPDTTETTVPQTTPPTTDPAAMPPPPPPPPAPIAPSAPQSVVAKPLSHAVKLTWSAPASNGGAAIDTYAVRRATSAAGPFTNVGFPTSTSFIDTGLTYGTTYYFVILAHNSAGWGATSTVVSAKPYTAPTAPQWPKALPGNQKVTVTWTAPASNGGAPISHYGVQRATSPAGPWTNVGYPSSTTFTNTGLTNGTTYYFRVHAYAATWGPWSTVVSTAPGTAPSAVPACSVEQGQAFPELLLIEWDAPVSDGGAQIDDYRIAIVRNGTPYAVESLSGEANTLFVFHEVDSSGMYDVYVQAVNKFGYGDVCHDVIYMDLWWLD